MGKVFLISCNILKALGVFPEVVLPHSVGPQLRKPGPRPLNLPPCAKKRLVALLVKECWPVLCSSPSRMSQHVYKRQGTREIKTVET